MRIRLGAAAVMIAALTVAGCDKEPQVSEAQRVEQGTPEEVVAKRAEKRWKSLIERRFETAYDYLSPAQRQVLERKKYEAQLESGTSDWKSARVESVTCRGEVCSVKVDVRFRYLGPHGPKDKELSTVLTESWIREQGNWWYSRKRVKG